MNRLFAYALIPMLAVSLGASVVELYSFAVVSRLAAPDQVIEAASRDQIDGARENIFVLGKAYEEAAALPLVAPETGYRAARLLYRTALLEKDPNQRIAYFCRTLGQLGESLARDPFNSRLLIHWANMRQLLADVSCSEAKTAGDYEQVARFALSRDPTNSEVIFSAAQVLLWADKKDEAFGMLRNFLQVSQRMSARQIGFIEGLLTSVRNVALIVPAQFPQVVEWSARIQSKYPLLFVEARNELSQLQLRALAENETSYKAGAVPSALYFERLSSLLNVVSSSQVRRRIDAELGRYYGEQGQETLQRYLDQRASTDSIDVVRGILDGDTRPLKSTFVRWEPLERFTADYFYSSVGFYLPHDTSVDFIELVGDEESAVIPTISFRLMASDDNQQWEDVTAETQRESLEFGRRARIIFSIKSIERRYWKVNFASSSREGRFTNTPSALINVYGKSAR